MEMCIRDSLYTNLLGSFLTRNAVSYTHLDVYKRQIEALRAGRSPTEIISFCGYPLSTVYDIAQKYADAEKSEEFLRASHYSPPSILLKAEHFCWTKMI